MGVFENCSNFLTVFFGRNHILGAGEKCGRFVISNLAVHVGTTIQSSCIRIHPDPPGQQSFFHFLWS